MQTDSHIDDDNYKAYKAYSGARGAVLTIAILSSINTALFILNIDVMFMFTAFIPYFAMIFGYIATGTQQLVCFGICGGALVFYFALWKLSEKKTGWLTFAAVFYGLDCLFMAGMTVSGILDNSYYINIALSVYIEFLLIRGVVMGRSIRMQGENTLEELNKAMPANPITPQFDSSKEKYIFDYQYAKEHKAYKMISFVLLVWASIIALSAGIMVSLVVFDASLPIFLGVLLLWLYAFIYIMVKLSPFIECRNIAYYIDEASTLHKVMRNAAGNMSLSVRDIPLNSLCVISSDESSWKCTYMNNNGRSAKITIPNAYPRLSDYMSSRGTSGIL